MGETAICLHEGGTNVADGDGLEFYLALLRCESCDVWGVLGGLLS